MVWTQQHIDDLKAAMATGMTEFQYSDGSRGVYRSVPDMQRLLALMQAEVDAALGVKPINRVVFTTIKGT
ncbi:phage head-tail joining protein [Azospirillum brasilense]|uniref:phage head-tail joining protein n=1 Tax=Azospirillum brasilense TaxID=192 RepID=UPI000E6798EC|nr:hypothetical protein [Azospirillum brasilense]NUB27217.1 hypothetical protein [Azospirillum brasilense]NUB30543.1 hypothetical protein [Azospirillum brasilense]RIW07771.1 hypothetical protein D2T81_02725 [Azospirillum brasilense]